MTPPLPPRFITILTRALSGAAQRCSLPPGVQVPPQLNFAACSATLNTLHTETSSHDAQWNDWTSCFFDGNPGNQLLTRTGCAAICGTGSGVDGYQADDTLQRLSLWIVPALALIGNFTFPPLLYYSSLKTYVAILAHAISNPIGSHRAILTRLEFHNRLDRIARLHLPGGDDVWKHMACILAEYEEIAWQDASATLPLDRKLDAQEMDIITKGSLNFVKARTTKTSSSIFAILTLLASIGSAIAATIKTFNKTSPRVPNETAHTIAIVCLFLNAIPLVWFSGRIGTFTKSWAPLQIMQDILGQLDEHARETGRGRETDLLPRLRLESRRGCRCLPENTSCPLDMDSWLRSSDYLGMNITWRPCRHLPAGARRRLGTRTFAAVPILCCFIGSYVPAFLLSYTNHRLNFGCRCLTWTFIFFGLWLPSDGVESLLERWFLQGPKPSPSPQHVLDRLGCLHRWIFVKDLIVAAIITAAVLMVETGVYNSCWCKALNRGYIDMNSLSESEWANAQNYWLGFPSIGVGCVLFSILWIEVNNGFRASPASRDLGPPSQAIPVARDLGPISQPQWQGLPGPTQCKEKVRVEVTETSEPLATGPPAEKRL